MNEAFVFGDIIRDEGVVNSDGRILYTFMIPYYNSKDQEGKISVYYNYPNLIYKDIYYTKGRKIGHVDMFIEVSYPIKQYQEYIEIIASFIPLGTVSPIAMSKPFSIKIPIQPPKAAILAQPDMAVQTPLSNFNVGTGSVVLVSSAFAVLLIMLYRRWKRSDQVKDDKA
jgi:hypothetical protein